MSFGGLSLSGLESTDDTVSALVALPGPGVPVPDLLGVLGFLHRQIVPVSGGPAPATGGAA